MGASPAAGAGLPTTRKSVAAAKQVNGRNVMPLAEETPGSAADLLERPGKEGNSLRPLLVIRVRQADLHGKNAAGAEARVDAF